MKRYIVEQTGFVQLEATRRFVVEVPDHISEDQAEQLVENAQEAFPEDEGMEWWDHPDRSWTGYDVEITETEVYDPDAVWGSPRTEELKVIRLEGHDNDTHK